MRLIPIPAHWVEGPHIATAVAHIKSLAQEYAVGTAIKFKTDKLMIELLDYYRKAAVKKIHAWPTSS